MTETDYLLSEISAVELEMEVLREEYADLHYSSGTIYTISADEDDFNTYSLGEALYTRKRIDEIREEYAELRAQRRQIKRRLAEIEPERAFSFTLPQ
ncbi:hypothetical protein [uncultured Paenibacillus sp.]|uniref:hypothetical protein n=1 Tax=uncultured Paenibacillus sp. TaxID=227322 RepID=UPI0015AA74E3|nr:hypothetical protein [uncultured Paenibacillus sp.]DAW22616.1 MAG TPA: hypothetical protein [Caudoviricetes sp.]